MKKILTLTTIIFFLFQKNITQAQFYFGADVGYFSSALLNQNNYGFSEMDYELTHSLGYGGNIGYAILNKHHFQSGVKFLSLGQNYTSIFDDVAHDRKVELNYLMIPLSYKMVLGRTGLEQSSFRAFFSVGGYFSLLQNANTSWFLSENEVSFLTFQQSQNRNKAIAKVEDLLSGNNDLEDQSEFYESSDFGVTISFGMRYMAVSGFAINFEILGGYGFSDVNSTDWRLLNDNGIYEKTNNLFGGIQFGIAYYFGIEGERF